MLYQIPEYESDQLISIIGTKRPLQEELRSIISQLLPKKGTSLFIDAFCGSGAVARVARSLGCRVIASDVEAFTFITNYVYLALHAEDISTMFAEFGGIDAYLTILNLQGLYASTVNKDIPNGFLSTYYAPSDDTSYDGNRERLFFTRSNALFLDTVREEIEQNWIAKKINAAEKCVALASVLYEASRKANTGGTFTSYYKRFGSYEQTALSRIGTNCELHAPVLPDMPIPRGSVRLESADKVVSSHSADICFIDPPATVHQYSSAYHLLNSIAIWDKPPIDERRNPDGTLVNKSGMREDRASTKSPFCSLKHADAAFVHLIGSIDARTVITTYPNSGIVSAERIRQLLSPRFRSVSSLILRKRNQGGRQPLDRSKDTFEHVIIAGNPETVSVVVETDVEIIKYLRILHEMESRVFNPRDDIEPFQFVGGILIRHPVDPFELQKKEKSKLSMLAHALEHSCCTTAEQSIDVLTKALRKEHSYPIDGEGRLKIEKKIVSLLRQHCSVATARVFFELFETVEQRLADIDNSKRLEMHLRRLKSVTQMRLMQ